MKELSTTVETQNFVKPHFIPELGCEGLTATEIAQSLGITSKEVRRKLKKGSLHNILKLLGEDVSQGRVEISTLHRLTTKVHEINNLSYEEYALTTVAAKMFVALYQNDTGRAYLAYLILLDTAVEKKMSSESQKLIDKKEKENLLLKESNADLKRRLEKLEAYIEPMRDYFESDATDVELEILDNLMQKYLKLCNKRKESDRREFVSHIQGKFYTRERGTFVNGITRGNWLKAKSYIENKIKDLGLFRSFR